MSEKKIAFTCWNNDPHRINEPGQCGVIHSRLFGTEKAARAYYKPPENCGRDDVIVRVVVETI